MNRSRCFFNLDVIVKSDCHPSQEQGRSPIPVDDIKASSISFMESMEIFASYAVRFISLAIDMMVSRITPGKTPSSMDGVNKFLS